MRDDKLSVQLSRFWHVKVETGRAGEVVARTCYLDPDYEIEAGLVAAAADYRVLDASVLIARGPRGRRLEGMYRLPRLHGLVAYGSVGRAVQEAVDEPSGLGAALILEAVKGLLQAECFLLPERGFTDEDAYEAYFWRDFRDSCYYYSRPGAAGQTFREHIEGQKRDHLLFSRYRCQQVDQTPGGWRLEGGLADSFHEMRLRLEVNSEGVVEVGEGSVLRATDAICRRALERVNLLRGLTLPASPREWQQLVGGRDGCTHLADLAREAAGSWDYFRQLGHYQGSGSHPVAGCR